MVERRIFSVLLRHALLVAALATIALPVYVAVIASTHPIEAMYQNPIPLLPGNQAFTNYRDVLVEGLEELGGAPALTMLANSTVMALGIAIGKIAISLLSAYAIVFFRFPLRRLVFWMIFVTLMLPVEVRIVPTFEIVADLGLLNTHAGLIIPLIASATATFLFRQFFMTIPDELVEAARVDGAGPLQFLRDVVIPLSRTNIAALFVILFLYGWNQYLWPLLVTTDTSRYTMMMGIKHALSPGDDITPWNHIMSMVVLAMLPPVLVVAFMRRWFVKGLIDSEK